MILTLANRSHDFNTTNNTNNSYTSSPNSVNELAAFKTIFQTLFAFFGVIGNLSVFAVITRNKKRKSSTELLIRNLAIADLGVLMLTFPLSVIKEKLPFNWPLGRFCCLYLSPTCEIFYGASVWTIVAIAVERYRHLVCPLKKDRLTTIKMVKRSIFILWIGCFLLFSAPSYYYMVYVEKEKRQECYFNLPTPETVEIFHIFMFLTWYCIPVFIILWSYILISRKLDQSSVFLRNMHASETGVSNTNRLSVMQERRLSQNRRVKRILTPVVVAFVLLMMPVNLGRLIILYYNSIVHNTIYPVIIYIFSLCIIINSSINPLIYSFASPGFRAGVRAFLKSRSYRSTLIPVTTFRAFGERLSFRRRTYAFGMKDMIELKSVRSVQTPIP